MGRGWQPEPQWRPTRIPLRLVERAYGRDNFDNAGDDIVSALREVSEWPDQYRSRFEFDRTHPNPWYHAMVFEIEGIPDPVYARFAERMAELGLTEGSG